VQVKGSSVEMHIEEKSRGGKISRDFKGQKPTFSRDPTGGRDDWARGTRQKSVVRLGKTVGSTDKRDGTLIGGLIKKGGVNQMQQGGGGKGCDLANRWTIDFAIGTESPCIMKAEGKG